MNRHFVNYYPDDTVLGTPIRREEKQSPETPWKPTDTPGYFRRINSEGRPEVSHVDNLPKPEPAGAAALVEMWKKPAVESPVTPDAAPWSYEAPVIGWYETQDDTPVYAFEARHWNGKRWSAFVRRGTPFWGKVSAMGDATGVMNIRWRGPRLTGPDWPEAA